MQGRFSSQRDGRETQEWSPPALSSTWKRRSPLASHPGIGIVDLVERLHPTPAVGGYPRDRALEAIARLEVIDRGWYAGPFGWAGLDGSGEFAVAIRSGLLSGRTASVFAGAGIVAGSAPKAELAETELKLRPMLAALGAE